MEKISLVRVSPETRKTIKQRVIRLHKKGIKGKEIADNLNLSEFAVSRIVSAFKKKGMKCVNEKTRGRKRGEKRALSPDQEKEMPTVPSFSKVEKINMISAINAQGTCRFMCYEDSMTQQRFIEFMTRLVHDSNRKVLFVVDNLKVHHGKKVQDTQAECSFRNSSAHKG